MNNTLTFDFNNMMLKNVKGGLSTDTVLKYSKLIPKVHEGVSKKNDKSIMERTAL